MHIALFDPTHYLSQWIGVKDKEKMFVFLVHMYTWTHLYENFLIFITEISNSQVCYEMEQQSHDSNGSK